MIPILFKIEADKQLTVYFREARTASEKESVAIVDANHDGRWIHGLELLGGRDFSLARAVKPFHPKCPSEAGGIGVTYDEVANAAFFYFSMKVPFTPGVPTPDFKYSRSLTSEVRFGFDDEGGLVWMRLQPAEVTSNIQDFLSLIDAPLQYA